MPNYIKLGNLRIEIPEPANNGGGGGGGEGLLNGLLAFYNLSDLTDASGNNRTLTNNGGVTFSSGKIGDAATFNGSNYFTSNIAENIQTVSAWIKTTTNSSYNVIYQNASQQLQFIGSGALRVNGIGGEQSVGSGVNDGSWHHCVFVLGDGLDCVYIDNQKYTLTTNYANAGSGPADIGSASGMFDFWVGQLDALGIWNRALTDAEITELYNAGAGKEHPFA